MREYRFRSQPCAQGANPALAALNLFWTYFWLLHFDRILNRVIRIAVIVTTGCHFYLVARKEVYFDATGFLAVIIRNRYYCAVFTILRFYFFSHSRTFLSSPKPGKSIEYPTPVSHSIFTVIPGSHFEGTPK